MLLELLAVVSERWTRRDGAASPSRTLRRLPQHVASFSSHRIVNKSMHAIRLTRSLCRPLHRLLCTPVIPDRMQPIESLNLQEIIEKTHVQKSAVSGLFVGKLDIDVLSFPAVIVEQEEIDHVRKQQSMITRHIITMIYNEDELQEMGFHDLNKLTATEITTVFEGIGLATHPLIPYESRDNPIHSMKYNNRIIDLINKNWQYAKDSTAKATAQLALSSYLMGRLKTHYKFVIESVDNQRFITPTVGREQFHLYEMIRDIYKLETMCYYFAGMIDSFEGRDLIPDGIVVKTSASAIAFRSMSLSSKLLGYNWSYGREYDLLNIFDEFLRSSFTSKILLGLHGLQEYGSVYAEEIENYRSNPREANKVKKPSPLGFGKFFDPNFHFQPGYLEDMVARLQLQTQIAYRKRIEDKVSTAIDLAEQAISIVQAICVLCRASRNIQLVVDNFDCDMILAEHEVDLLYVQHKQGDYMSRKELMNEKMMELGGYYSASPFLILPRKEGAKQLPSQEDGQERKQLT